MHLLENFAQKKDRYDKKSLGVIGKREPENDVMWITLQAQQFKWNKVTITKVKEDGIDFMYILYAYSKHRENFFKLETVQEQDKKTTHVPIFSCCLKSLAQFLVIRKKVVGAARNCDSMGRSKGTRDETDFPPHS